MAGCVVRSCFWCFCCVYYDLFSLLEVGTVVLSCFCGFNYFSFFSRGVCEA